MSFTATAATAGHCLPVARLQRTAVQGRIGGVRGSLRRCGAHLPGGQGGGRGHTERGQHVGKVLQVGGQLGGALRDRWTCSMRPYWKASRARWQAKCSRSAASWARPVDVEDRSEGRVVGMAGSVWNRQARRWRAAGHGRGSVQRYGNARCRRARQPFMRMQLPKRAPAPAASALAGAAVPPDRRPPRPAPPGKRCRVVGRAVWVLASQPC